MNDETLANGIWHCERLAPTHPGIALLLAEYNRLRAERRDLWRFVKPEEGAQVVYVGVHAMRWYEAAGAYEPTAGFVRADDGE